VARIIEAARKAAITPHADLSVLEESLQLIAPQSYVDNQLLGDLLATACSHAVAEALEDDVLSEAEERALVAFKSHFDLPADVIDRSGAYVRLAKAGVLRDVMNGQLQQRVEVQGILPFNFQRSETLIWLFQNVPYYESRTRTTHAGGHSGVSLRVTKGVYYRLGGFKGNPVVTTALAHVDTGLLAVTDKHLYFAGNTKAFRIRYDKIVSFAPYDDDIGVQRDASTAKPQIFVTGDEWFTYNLITNPARIS